MRRGAKVTLVG